VKVAIVSTSDAEATLLRLAASDVPATIAWCVPSADAAAARLRSDAPDALVVCLGAGAGSVAAVVRACRAASACPIIVCAADPDRHTAELYAATSAAAVDVARAPHLDASGRLADPGGLVGKLRRAGRVTGAGKPEARVPVLAIAASTGGPAALAQVLRDLPPDLCARIVLAQHIADEFVAGLASFLAAESGRPVEVGEGGATLDARRALLVRARGEAAEDGSGQILYHRPRSEPPFSPCIDALFTSLATAIPARGVAALLTGMGSDGAEGLLALRRAGWLTFAQDAASSVVYGMPKAAADKGAAVEVVDLAGLGSALGAAVQRVRDGART
jgi:two-component system response regulator WspF